MTFGMDSPWPSLSGGLRACGDILSKAIEEYIVDAPEEEYQRLLADERLMAALETWHLDKKCGPIISWSDSRGYKTLARKLNALCQEMYTAAAPHIKSYDFREAVRIWLEEQEGWFPPQPPPPEPIKWPSWFSWTAFKDFLKRVFFRKKL